MANLTKKCLVTALKNISGKEIPADKLATCRTTCEVIDAFNDLYRCTVTFSGLLNSTNISSDMKVTVKDSDGNVVSPTAVNKYTLDTGDYTYDATVSGAVAKEGVAFSISSADVQSGTKNVVITFTAA